MQKAVQTEVSKTSDNWWESKTNFKKFIFELSLVKQLTLDKRAQKLKIAELTQLIIGQLNRCWKLSKSPLLTNKCLKMRNRDTPPLCCIELFNTRNFRKHWDRFTTEHFSTETKIFRQKIFRQHFWDNPSMAQIDSSMPQEMGSADFELFSASCHSYAKVQKRRSV